MNADDWGANLELEHKLDAAEEAALDRALTSEQQAQVARWVAELDDDEPNLVWRSALNERLLAVAPKPVRKRRWLAPLGGFAAGAVAASVWFFLATAKPFVAPAPEASTATVESGILAAHEQSGALMDVGGSPVTTVASTSTQPSDDLMWTEEDLRSL